MEVFGRPSNPGRSGGPATIDAWLQSNLCRCTSYQEIGQAVRRVPAE